MAISPPSESNFTKKSQQGSEKVKAIQIVEKYQ